uniref:Venom protein n=1 Tax=Hemiscolopendra marginata TaxID=943146 RepID=A0A646QFF7_9MYRI
MSKRSPIKMFLLILATILAVDAVVNIEPYKDLMGADESTKCPVISNTDSLDNIKGKWFIVYSTMDILPIVNCMTEEIKNIGHNEYELNSFVEFSNGTTLTDTSRIEKKPDGKYYISSRFLGRSNEPNQLWVKKDGNLLFSWTCTLVGDEAHIADAWIHSSDLEESSEFVKKFSDYFGKNSFYAQALGEFPHEKCSI